MSSINYYSSKLINLKGFCVENFEICDNEINIYGKMELKEHTCPCCGHKTTKVHDYRNQKIKDISMFAKQVYKKIIDNVDLSIEDFGLTRWAYGDAWNSGYGLGKSLVDKLDAFELGKVPDMGSLTANDNSLEDTLGDVADGVDSIANNTEEIKNNSDIVDLIRDYHSRLATQKSTTQYVTIDMSGQTNHINKSMELSDLMDSIVNSARQAAAVMTEGV